MIESKSPSKPEKLLRLPAVEQLTGLKKSTIYAGLNAKPPTFPAPIRLSARAVAWRESDIATWQAQCQQRAEMEKTVTSAPHSGTRTEEPLQSV